jgi:hypothetical protein
MRVSGHVGHSVVRPRLRSEGLRRGCVSATVVPSASIEEEKRISHFCFLSNLGSAAAGDAETAPSPGDAVVVVGLHETLEMDGRQQ